MRVMRLCSSSGSEKLCYCLGRTALNIDNKDRRDDFGDFRGNGFFDDRYCSISCQSITCSNFNRGKRLMYLAIMVCAVCWKKVLMETL